jgi:hypothetical protein
MQMVNAKFPASVAVWDTGCRYGFEMVDLVDSCPQFMPGNRHKSKIYAESNDSNPSKIRVDLTSMQTLAIYRRLLVQGLRANKGRPESRDVLSASLGVLDWARARAVAQRQET